MIKIPLSRPAETTNPGFVYSSQRISLTKIETGTAQPVSIHELSGDWEAASDDYEAQGQFEKAAQCAEKAGDRLRALKLCKQAGEEILTNFLQEKFLPWLAVRLRTDTLVSGEWDTLDIEIENQGYGPAQDIVVSVQSPSISAEPYCISGLQPRERVGFSLSVFAVFPGVGVPFDLHLKCNDNEGFLSVTEQSFTFKVIKPPEPVTQIYGPVYNGPVDQSRDKVEAGGIKVGGDVGMIKEVGLDAARSGGEVFQFCPYCGKKYSLPKTPRFCPFCGEALQ
jgi:hypothetical protein